MEPAKVRQSLKLERSVLAISSSSGCINSSNERCSSSSLIVLPVSTTTMEPTESGRYKNRKCSGLNKAQKHGGCIQSLIYNPHLDNVFRLLQKKSSKNRSFSLSKRVCEGKAGKPIWEPPMVQSYAGKIARNENKKEGQGREARRRKWWRKRSLFPKPVWLGAMAQANKFRVTRLQFRNLSVVYERYVRANNRELKAVIGQTQQRFVAIVARNKAIIPLSIIAMQRISDVKGNPTRSLFKNHDNCGYS